MGTNDNKREGESLLRRFADNWILPHPDSSMIKDIPEKDPKSLVKWTVRIWHNPVSCVTTVRLFEDKLELIRKKKGEKIYGHSQEIVYFREIDNITITYAKKGKLFETSRDGVIKILCKPNTRYYEYSRKEAPERNIYNFDYSEPNEILFDEEYNSVVETNFPAIIKALEEYKIKEQTESENHNASVNTTLL